MTKPTLQQRVREARARGRICEIDNCGRFTVSISRWCQRHHDTNERTGDPRGITVTKAELRPYADVARAFINRNLMHPAVRASLRWITAALLTPQGSLPRLRPNAHPTLRLAHFAERLQRCGVYPEEVLATIVGMSLMREDKPHTFRSDRHFSHQVSMRVLRLAKGRWRSHYRDGEGGNLYDRIPVNLRELLSGAINRSIGVAVLGMARHLLPTIRPPLAQHDAALEGIRTPFDAGTINTTPTKDGNNDND